MNPNAIYPFTNLKNESFGRQAMFVIVSCIIGKYGRAQYVGAVIFI